MIIYPAIDLINGECVRLYKGDFEQKTVYQSSPVEVAQSYKDQGAEWLHLVDLDGAKDPEKRQLSTISKIIAATDLKVQTGGGIRSKEDVEMLMNAGASRIVIGSLSVKDVETTKSIIQEFGEEKICLAADVMPKNNEYYVAVSGWQAESDITLDNIIKKYEDVSLKHVLCTDISRDGAMTGSNIALYETLQEEFPDLHIQASGGVKSLDDVRDLNTAGVIIGKALYENVFTVEEAIGAVTC